MPLKTYMLNERTQVVQNQTLQVKIKIRKMNKSSFAQFLTLIKKKFLTIKVKSCAKVTEEKSNFAY